MTPEDTGKIVAAIDRNTKAILDFKSSVGNVGIWLFLLWFGICVVGCPRAKAAPMLPPLSESAPLQHVPEPGTLWIAGVAIGAGLWVWAAHREARKWKKIEEDQDRRFNQICSRIDIFRTALVHIAENSECLDSQCVARKALEE